MVASLTGHESAVEDRILVYQTPGEKRQEISSVFTCIGALGTPSRTGPSLESIYRVSLTVDLCEVNKIISFKKFSSPQPVGGPSKRKKIRGPWARAQCADWLRRPCKKYLREGGERQYGSLSDGPRVRSGRPDPGVEQRGERGRGQLDRVTADQALQPDRRHVAHDRPRRHRARRSLRNILCAQKRTNRSRPVRETDPR